jgi:hypothetical protein
MACGRWDVEVGGVARLMGLLKPPTPDQVRAMHPLRSLERVDATTEEGQKADAARGWAMLEAGLKSTYKGPQ